MKVNSLFLLIFVLTTFTNLLFAATYSYEIEEVESIDVSTGVEFTVWCADVNKIEILADSEDDFQMSLEDKKLKIKRKNKNSWLFLSWGKTDVTADITLKNPPKYIELTTGSIGKIQNCFKKDADLNLSASTGSSFEIDKGSGSINQMKVDLSTGAAIKIEKNLHINHLSLNASTGSTFESGNEVVIESSEVMVSSGASVDIYGTLEISGKVSSGGNIEVEKNTIRTDITTSTGGSLNVDC